MTFPGNIKLCYEHTESRTQRRNALIKIPKPSAPKPESPAPVRELSAPVRELSAPVRKLSAPVRELSAPVRELSAPVREVNKYGVVLENCKKIERKEFRLVR